MTRAKRKRLILSLTEEKQRWLEEMRIEDYETEEPMASYIVRMITREKKRRDEEKAKSRPGRPRKEGETLDEVAPEKEERQVPHPDKILARQGVMVTEDEANAIISLRGK